MRKLVLLLTLLSIPASGEPVALTEKAARYHSLLLKRPKPGAIYERFASAWLEDGDIASLRTFLEGRAISAQATTADRLVLGFFLSQQSEHDAAINVIAKALEADPANSEAWLLRAQTEARVSKHAEALKSLEKVQGASGDTASEAAKLKARLLARSGQTAESLGVLKALATAHLDDEDLQDEVVELHLDEGLQGEAIDFLKALLVRTKDPYQRVVRRLRLGDILKSASNRDEALAAYSQCLDDAAQDSWVEGEVLAQIEQTFRSKDDLTGLKSFLEKLAEKQSQRLALGQLHARVLLDLNEADAAILAYRDLLKKHPGNLALSESFIEVLVRAQKFEDAVVQCRELLVQRKGDKELRIQLATLLYQARQPGDAIKELQPLIADAKTPEFELMRVARLYESFEHADDARKLYQRAVDSYPASITAQDALASYMHAHKEQISAVSIWKKQAVAPAPKEEVLRVARALSSRGEHEAALEVLQAREKEFPDDTPYLTQLISIASSAQRPELASGWAMTLVKLANDGQTLADALRVVRPAFRDPDLAGQAVKTLQSVAAPSIQQRCLLAELLEQSGDPEGADKVLASAAGGDLLMAQRQQARLYVIRQDYEKAASTLEQVASGGNDVGVIEEIVGLYQRASLYDRVLKWIGEWKQALPGSTRPWLAEARTLQAQQKSDQAVAVLKQAARKFSDDVSMATALAEAYVNNSQQADAQRIYQQLYDEAEDLPAQIRWAGQLAESAQRRGTLKELLESFQERQRGNRTSIAPWLAIAEIHRRTRNYEGRRTAMLEASRLKPKDIDLLHQIARVDEEQGDWRKAIETLATAASLDKSDKSRHRMAEVHLRYGDEETGLRMIFELGGGGDMDPRDAEGMIVGLMARGNWKMALTVIAPLLTRHPEDYRLRYLKLVCHLEDDSVDAAINEAVVLMGARVEVLTPSKSKSVTSLPSLVPEQMDPVEQLVGNITAWSYQALRYRDELRQLSQLNRYFISSSSSGTQYSFVPSTVDLVKPMVTALLVRARYESAWPEDKLASVIKQLAAAGHPVAQSVQWFELGSRGGPSLSIILAEVEKNIGNAQLVGLWMSQLQGRRALSSLALSPQLMQRLQSRGVNVGSLVTGSGSGAALAAGASPERKLLGRIYEHYLKLRPLTAASAAIKLWQTDDKDSEALDKAVALAATVPVKDQVSVYTYTAPLGTGTEPAALRTPAGRKLRDAALLVMKRYAEAHPAEARWLARAPAMHAAVGDWEAFVTSLNDAADDKASPAYRSGVFFGGSISFQPISSYHIMSAMDGVPYDVISALMMRSSGSSMAPMAADDAKALAAAATKLKDPNMRAIVAWRTEDKAAIKAYAQQQMEGNNPILWPLLVMASEAAVDKPAEAVPWLIRARTATTQRDMISTIDAALVHSVTGLISDKKMDLAKPYLAAAQSSVLALRRAMATSSSYELEQLASAMEKLGMKDEAERQRKALAAVRQSQRSAFSSMASTTSDPYQLSNDIRNGKGATAIPQVIRALRALAGTLATGSSYNASYEMRRWTTLANDHPAAAGEMWQQLNSSPAITLKQKLERAVLADILGREEVAIGIYSEAVKTKPRDAFLRLRLAMLQLRSEAGVKIALENLLAVSPADISNEARSLNLTDGDTLHLEQRFNLARLVTLYLQQVKSKAKPGDLDWCAKTLDMLMSGNWSNGPRIPNMLEESPDGDKEVQDTLAKREVLFDEFCKVAIDMPDLAHHILPALFALARHRKQDTGDIIQRARVALTGLAAAQNSGVSFSIGNDWQENYSGTWSGQRMWTPMLPEMLLFDANQRKQEKQFKDEVVPLIRQAYSIEAGNEFELRARLWFCEESEFLAAVQELESLKNRRGNSGSIPSSRADLVRVWSERGLKVSLDELIATYVRDMNRRNYGVDSHVVGPYLEGLLERGTAADLARAIKGLLGALLDKPEVEWREFLAANPPMPGQLRSQHVAGSPQDRIRRVNSAAGSLCSESAVLRMHIMGVLADHGFHKYESFTNLSSSYRHQSLPERASELVQAMEATPFIRDIDTFDVLEPARDGYRSGFEHLTDMIQRRGSNYSAAMVESLQKRQEKHRTFGASLMIAKLVELTPDLVLTLQPHAEAFSKEPAARQEMLLKVIRTVWADFDRQAVQSPSLAPYAAGLRQSGLAGAEKLLAAKATKDIEPNDSKYEKKLQEAVVQAVVLDPTKASQALEHGVKLLMEKQAKEGWGGSTWSNGCNLASGMLERTCGLAGGNALRSTAPPALEIMGMALRVYEQPEQRLYLCTYREADFRWGEMMRVYWERSGGFKEPRKAVRTLLAELTRVLGTATPVLLPEAFRSMAEDVPRWHRAVILDEATTLSSGPGAEAAIARELVTGFGLISREPGAVADLKARLNDGKLHPLIRPVVAAVLTEYAMSSLSAAEVHQCLETTLPLLENSWPAATSIWAPLLNAFNLQPASPEWDALAKRFREAWMHRARFNAKGAKSGLALEMQVTVAAHVLELFARSASTEELAKFHSTYAKAIDRNVDSVLILARHNKPDLLRQVLKANDGSLTGANSTTRAIKFRSTDIAVTQVIDEAMKADARLTARGRLLAVSAPDSTAQIPKPGRAERLRLEAERFVKDRDKEKLVGDPALVVLVDTAVSAAVLLPALTTQMEWKVEMTRATRATGATAIGELLDVPLALALAALAQGDDKPWRQVTDAITESKAGNPGYSLWNTLSHRIATVSMRHVREQGLDKTGWVTGALRDLLNSVPTNINLEAATSLHFMNALLRGQGKELDQWRQKLPKDRQKQLVPQDALWLEYCLDAMPPFPDEDGGKTLLTVLADPWAKAATRTANDLRYRGKWPARLEDAELRQHTEALLQADPGNLAVLTTVMDSWSSQKDQKPLLMALLAVKPKLDTTKDKKALERIAAVETEAK